jgi:hypothetical protein
MKKAEKKTKKSVPAPPPVAERKIPEELIRQRAHEIFLERGGQPGQELEDWLQAERELRQKL